MLLLRIFNVFNLSNLLFIRCSNTIIYLYNNQMPYIACSHRIRMSTHRSLRLTTATNSEAMKIYKELFECATRGKLPQFKGLLSSLLKNTSPGDIFQSKEKGSPLILAAQRGQHKIVNYILKNFIKDVDLEYSMTIKSEFTGHEVAGATALWCAALGMFVCSLACHMTYC